MSEFFDFSDRGLLYTTDVNQETGGVILHTKGDCDPVLEHMKRIRNSGENDKGIKNEFWHYCTIPAAVEVALRDRGIDIYDKNCTKDLLKIINEEYPDLKATRLHHE
jgi:hypothetical protein